MRKLVACVGVLTFVLGAGVVRASAVEPHFFPYSDPSTPASPSYTGTTCLIDLSGIPDGYYVDSVTGCGVTVLFSVLMQKVTAEGTWGTPPATESDSAAVLVTGDGESGVTLTYRSGSRGNTGRRTVGFEASPGAFFSPHDMSASFNDAGGNTLGTIARSAAAPKGNVLFAARTKGTAKIRSVALTSSPGDDGGGIAIAHLRV